ncbi:hypothetical protein R1flu_013791 [Riccia fluitans]|uniref:Malectin-like domain-containing protein n=1 Tax=Riccia fluitans TaxID=41844 RepID=A0ABD1YEK2_9MARC
MFFAVFLSIDSGAKQNVTDGIGMEWVTDEGYISTGSTLKVPALPNPGQEALTTARYFPGDWSKSCYVLPAVGGKTYLVRVGILHGEAPELPLPVEFNFTINSNYWFTFSLIVGDRGLLYPFLKEAIFYNQRDHIDVCVTRAAQGIPWISTLELRQMPEGTYSIAKSENMLMYALYRYNMGIKVENEVVVRWPDDLYDRVWYPADLAEFPKGERVSNSTEIFVLTDPLPGYNLPPYAVMKDALVGPDLTFDWPLWKETEAVHIVTYHQRMTNASEHFLVGFEKSMTVVNLTDYHAIQLMWSQNISAPTVNITIVGSALDNGDAVLNAMEVYGISEIDSTFTFDGDGKW